MKKINVLLIRSALIEKFSPFIRINLVVIFENKLSVIDIFDPNLFSEMILR